MIIYASFYRVICPLAVDLPHGSPVLLYCTLEMNTRNPWPLVGRIPVELGQLKVIVEINLANNRLSGE